MRKRGRVAFANPEHWRRRAQELRSIADELTVFARAKASLLRAAEEYDRLAMRAASPELEIARLTCSHAPPVLGLPFTEHICHSASNPEPGDLD
jgi:hypothetical protein